MSGPLDLALCVQLACLWEATARKPGNVHRFADFASLHYLDFLHSSAALGGVFAHAEHLSLGAIVLRAVQATRRVVATNTNLGIILLLAPLAKVPRETPIEDGVAEVLAKLTVEDSRKVYRAISIACPGGMGKVDDQDLAHEPTAPLRKIMSLAQDRDAVARQYALGFAEVFEMASGFVDAVAAMASVEQAIVHTHLRWMAATPDSLIARKNGLAIAEDAQRLAQAVLDADWPDTPSSRKRFAELDAWLRADGTLRNPGTSADLTTACIFLALRDQRLGVPLQVPWSRTE